jgi:hypothetical protein
MTIARHFNAGSSPSRARVPPGRLKIIFTIIVRGSSMFILGKLFKAHFGGRDATLDISQLRSGWSHAKQIHAS